MYFKLFLFTSFSIVLIKGEDLILLAKTHTTPLSKYVRYFDCVILHFQVPLDLSLACFKFEAEEIQLSLFRCKPRNITVYLKHGSPPVINPDGAKFPKGFINSSRPMEKIEFKSLEEPGYINVSSPNAGSYFAAAFISYTDPNFARITQQGLTPNCDAIITASLLVTRKPKPIIVVADVNNDVLLESNAIRVYKFYVFDLTDSTTLFIKNIRFCDNCTALIVKVQSNKMPLNESLYNVQLKKEEYSQKSYLLRIITTEESWYYISFSVESKSKNLQSNFEFQIRHSFSTENMYQENNTSSNVTNVQTVFHKRSVLRDYESRYLEHYVEYEQYDLIRSSHTESFLYSFDFHAEEDVLPVPINITNKDMVVLKFHITRGVDIGGTLQFGLAFKPKIRINGKIRKLVDEPKNHTIVACLRNKDKEIPVWPNKCTFHGLENNAALILNDTVKNSTLFLPFPESGNWYASLRLFCGECKPCKCPASCKKQYKNCYNECETNCGISESCSSCIEECEKSIINKTDCVGCDCDGPCQKTLTSCNSSLLFEVASYPCVTGQCGVNGKCMYMIAEGFSYSVCFCMNNYKGWDCSDNSSANSYGMIILELLLLVLSNLAFLPATYVAYKRRYYVEAIVYFSTFFFSSTYHACDSGENIYTVCITRLSVLQFSDFFCGLLSIWVTIIAIAYLPNPLPSIFHIIGAITLAFITTIDKTALWAFIIPFVTGTLILIISWYRHYKKTGKRFPSNRYLFRYFPAGILVVAAGLLIFGLLQTKSNYMYLHSFWHVCMAISIILLLPGKSFVPSVQSNGSQVEHITGSSET